MTAVRKSFKSPLLAGVVLFVTMACSTPALAQDDEGPRPVVDARLEAVTIDGKTPIDVTKPIGGSSALNWFLFFILAAIAAGVMFKDARRSHLD